MSSTLLTVVDDLIEATPIEPGKLGHHTVLKTPEARVIVLTFEAGYVMKEHSAPKPLLIQALSGRLTLTVGSRIIDLMPGMLVHLEPLLRHEVEAVEDSRLMLTLVG